MSITDVLEMPDNASAEQIYNCYVRMTECLRASLERIGDSHDTVADNLYEKRRQLKAHRSEVSTDIVNSGNAGMDGDSLFFEALDRINSANDINGCKKAAELLGEYLINSPYSVMGKTLLDVISEQFKV